MARGSLTRMLLSTLNRRACLAARMAPDATHSLKSCCLSDTKHILAGNINLWDQEAAAKGSVFPTFSLMPGSTAGIEMTVRSRAFQNDSSILCGIRGMATKAKKGKKQKKGGRDDEESEEDEGISEDNVAEDTPRGKKAAKGGKGKGVGVGANPNLPSGEILDVVRTAKEQMEAALDALRRELSKLRTGRASTGMLDHVMVESYGTNTPLNRVGSVAVRGPQLLAVTLFDPSQAGAVEKGIRQSPMGLNPGREGDILLVPIPSLTGEIRQAMCKLVVKAGEAAKLSIRRARKEALDGVKKNEEGLADDDMKRRDKEIQDLTNKGNKQIDDMGRNKEKEIMSGP